MFMLHGMFSSALAMASRGSIGVPGVAQPFAIHQEGAIFRHLRRHGHRCPENLLQILPRLYVLRGRVCFGFSHPSAAAGKLKLTVSQNHPLDHAMVIADAIQEPSRSFHENFCDDGGRDGL